MGRFGSSMNRIMVVVLALAASSSCLAAPQRPEDGSNAISAECEGITDPTDNFRCRLQGERHLVGLAKEGELHDRPVYPVAEPESGIIPVLDPNSGFFDVHPHVNEVIHHEEPHIEEHHHVEVHHEDPHHHEHHHEDPHHHVEEIHHHDHPHHHVEEIHHPEIHHGEHHQTYPNLYIQGFG